MLTSQVISLEFVHTQREHFRAWDPFLSHMPQLAVCFTMDIFHVHFEVVISSKFLVAKLAFCHWSIGVVSQLVSDQHLLQAEGQITNLRQWRQDKLKRSLKISSMYRTLYVLSLRPQTHVTAILNKWAGLWKNNCFRKHLTLSISMSYSNSVTTGTGGGKGKRSSLQNISTLRCPSYTVLCVGLVWVWFFF